MLPKTPLTASHGHLQSVPETQELPPLSPGADQNATRGRTGLGSLMQTAKRDVQVPEFDMNAFF
jgi:hypothetical protein